MHKELRTINMHGMDVCPPGVWGMSAVWYVNASDGIMATTPSLPSWSLDGLTADRLVLLLTPDSQWDCHMHTCDGQTLTALHVHLFV